MTTAPPPNLNWLSSATTSLANGAPMPSSGSLQTRLGVDVINITEGNDWVSISDPDRVSKGYVINPFTGAFAGAIIREGSLVFMSRSVERSVFRLGQDETPFTVADLFILNQSLREGHYRALSKLSDLKRTDPHNPFLKAALTSEMALDALMGETLEDHQTNLPADYSDMVFLTKKAILTRWNVIGFSSRDSRDRRNADSSSYVSLTLNFNSYQRIENVFGVEAVNAAVLFVVLTRIKEPDSSWGPLAFVPVPARNGCLSGTVPLTYPGLGGSTEMIWGKRLAIVDDPLGLPLGPGDLRYINGLKANSNVLTAQEKAKQISRLTVISAQNLYNRWTLPYG